MVLLLAALASAQDCLHIDGPVVTAEAELSGLYVADGVVIDPRDGCETLTLTPGQQVTPGFVAVGTQLGLVEVGAVGGTNQHAAGGDSPFRAAFVAVDAYNPQSTVIPVTRLAGVTHSVVFPDGGVVAGQAGWVRLAGATQADAVVDASVAVVGGRDGHIGQSLRTLRGVFDDARWLRRNGPAVDRGAARELAAHPSDLAALWPVLDGDVPLVVHADRASDIEALLSLREAYDLRLVIDGGAEAWQHADALAQAGVAVILDPTVFGPGSFNQVHARPDNAALLETAGVDVMFGHTGTHNARLVAHHAGVAVGKGMTHRGALAALTTTPMRVFGQAAAPLTVGASASFVVWESITDVLPTDPFEPTTRAVAVYIDGVEQDMRSRQTELRDRYRTLPGSPLTPLDPQ